MSIFASSELGRESPPCGLQLPMKGLATFHLIEMTTRSIMKEFIPRMSAFSMILA